MLLIRSWRIAAGGAARSLVLLLGCPDFLTLSSPRLDDVVC